MAAQIDIKPLGMTQQQLAAEILRIGGREIAQTSISDIVRGEGGKAATALMAALVALLLERRRATYHAPITRPSADARRLA